MTARERILAVISGKPPDRIPTDAIHIENIPQLAEYLQIEPDSVMQALSIDTRIVTAHFTRNLNRTSIQQDEDEWGTQALDEYSLAHSYPLAALDQVSLVEKYPWPDPNSYDFHSAALQAKKFAREGFATRGPYWMPIFCRVCSMLGMEQTMVQMLTEPKLTEAIIEQVANITYQYCEHFITACGDDLDVFCIGDDFATQRGLMISPALWRKFLKPCYAKLFAIAKKAGKPVWFHSCGDITSVLPDLIDIGMDVWETVQLHTLPISAETLKAEYGKSITFFGGINTQWLPFAAPSQVESEVLRCIDALGKNGRYICGPDHHIKPDVSPINTITLFKTAAGFQKEGYTLGTS